MDEHTEQPEGELETPGPVGLSERIVALDVLRGFALLGILIPNIQAYSMAMAAIRRGHSKRTGCLSRRVARTDAVSICGSAVL